MKHYLLILLFFAVSNVLTEAKNIQSVRFPDDKCAMLKSYIDSKSKEKEQKGPQWRNFVLEHGKFYKKILQKRSCVVNGIEFNWNFEGGSLDSARITPPDTLITCLDSTWVIGKTYKDSIIVLSNDTLNLNGKRFEVKLYVTALPDSLKNYTSIDIVSRLDPLNPADTLLKPSGRWYYFLMKGVKDKPLILNIINSEARRPFYSYDNKNFTRFSKEESPDESKLIKIFRQDSVYISYFIPYTTQRLNKKIEEWSRKSYVKVSSIGKSYEGRDMQLLTISDNFNENENANNIGVEITKHKNGSNIKSNTSIKKKVYIHGRVHTSESPASWHLEKMIDMITDTTEYSRSLRDNIDFYILPFANPDGVANGLSRSNLQGINLEVDHAMLDSLTAPEVKNIRAFLIDNTSKGKPFDLFLNMHSQIANFVTYWIHTKKSSSVDFFANLMLFCNLTTDNNKYFGKENYCYSAMNSKYLEGWMWDNFKDTTLAITFETPYTFYNHTADSTWVTLENLQELSVNNVTAIGDYFQINTKKRIFLNEETYGLDTERDNDKRYLFFGKSFIRAKTAGAKVKYSCSNLDKGKYDLYIWKVGKAGDTDNPEINSWIMVGTVENPENGDFKFIYKCAKKGEMVDNMMLIKK